MAICFDAIGEKYVTFLASEGTEQGAVCKLSANDTVGGCGENDVFCGVAAEVKDGCAAVVMCVWTRRKRRSDCFCKRGEKAWALIL